VHRPVIQELGHEVNRLHKALENAGIKLDCVAADSLRKCGRDILDALVAGTSPRGASTATSPRESISGGTDARC
jgi:hypothetical protein